MRTVGLFLFLCIAWVSKANKIIDNDILFDGRVEMSEWANSETFTINYEIDPGNNVPAPFQTQVFINYSDEYLYVGFIAGADMPNLRTSIRNRDEAWQDDFVMIGIDTYGDGRYMVNFGSNADGSPLDMKFTAEGNDDVSYNVNFESKASKHEEAYHVELKIPFNVLQYKKQDLHQWKVLLYRSTYSGDNRSQNINFPVDRANDCLPCQATSSISLKNISSKKRVVWIPSMVGSVSGTREGDALNYEKVISHSGGYDGMYSRVFLIPELNFAGVILTNSMTGIGTYAMYEILERKLGSAPADWSEMGRQGLYRGFDRRAAQLEAWSQTQNTEMLPTLSRDAMKGTYHCPLYGVLEVVETPSGGLELHFEKAPLLTADLLPWNGDTWYLDWHDTHAWFDFGTVQFTKDNLGHVKGLEFFVPNGDIFFEEINAQKK
jgi:hypothetical protein